MTRRFLLTAGLFALVLTCFIATPFTGGAKAQIESLQAAPVEVQSVVRSAGKVQSAGEPMTGVIVTLEGDSAARYAGGVAGLAATNARARGATRLAVDSPECQAYLAHLDGQHADFEAACQRQIPGARIVHRYQVILNAVSMLVPESRLEDVSKLPGVTGVYPDDLLQIDTFRTPQFIGATGLWDWVGGQTSAGEGVIVGVLDTGMWPESPAYADPDRFGNPYPPPPAKWTGTTCDFGSADPLDPPFTCNNKLIGAYRFMDTYELFGPALLPGEVRSARDTDGHGTHTSSTAAGNGRVRSQIFGASLGTLSGIAPRAHVVAYKVCGGLPGVGGCFTSDSARAVQQAIVDGVDVLNFSIGGGTNPYSDIVSLAFLDAYEAGVFVAASAGNSGPGANTVSHREPWVTTVGASTYDRAFEATANLTAGGGASLSITGASIGTGVSPAAPVVLASDPPYSDLLCLNPAAPGTFDGRIVVCQRGIIARVAKSLNVSRGGAVGMIMYNPTVNTLNADPHVIPSIHVQNDVGATLVAFMNANTGEQGTLGPGTAVTAQGDVMAAFSSRGGSGQTLGISKPDVTAPGVNVLAGFTPIPFNPDDTRGLLFNFLSGTSMSSPHVAGAGALLKRFNPDWTPGQIKSALMTSAKVAGVTKENGVTQADFFDMGSGRIDLHRVSRTELTFDASALDYFTHRNDLWNTNYPSIYIPSMPGAITVRRTAHNDVNRRSTWFVRALSEEGLTITVPPNLVVPARGDASFDIHLDARNVPIGGVRRGVIVIGNGGTTHTMPVTIVRREPAVRIAKSCVPTSIFLGETTQCTMTATNTAFTPASVRITDVLPSQLRLVPGSVSGATESGNGLVFDGTLFAASPPVVDVAPGASPFGYFPIPAAFIIPCSGNCDDTGFNFNVASLGGVLYNGVAYNTVGMATNGFVQLGGLTSVTATNQNLPNPANPNNVLATLWTDLHPLGGDGMGGGTLRAASLSSGGRNWLVLEWKDVFEFGGTTPKYTFQTWLRTGGTVQDISYVYARLDGTGASGRATVGAENADGTIGDTVFFNGSGTFPAVGGDLLVNAIPGAPGETKTIRFSAIGRRLGPWQNCGLMTSNLFQGTNISCTNGEVIPIP